MLWEIILIDVLVGVFLGFFFIYKPLKHNEKHKWIMVSLAVFLIVVLGYFSTIFVETEPNTTKTSLFPTSCDVLEEETYIQSCKKTDESHCYLYKTNESIGIERLSNGVIFITAFDYNEGKFLQYTYYDNKKHPNQGTQESFITKIHDRIAQYYIHLQQNTFEYTRVKQFLTCFEDVVKQHDPEVINRILEKRNLERARKFVEEKKNKLSQQLGENFTGLDNDLFGEEDEINESE